MQLFCLRISLSMLISSRDMAGIETSASAAGSALSFFSFLSFLSFLDFSCDRGRRERRGQQPYGDAGCVRRRQKPAKVHLRGSMHAFRKRIKATSN